MQEANVVNIVDKIFFNAINQGASDIHIEPMKDKMIVRYRIDGILKMINTADLNLMILIIARIKILAGLDTTGLPRPQEGKIKFTFGNKDADLRVSVYPTTLGECIVIRILESLQILSHYPDLGFSKEQSAILDDVVNKPYGLILSTGPNGSGKSTTLFTILNQLNDPDKSIVTLEDPVERKIEMVRQTQVNPEIGLTFATGLRYLLRQDPDIIMVGEIRDKETAHIAVEAAITGHLVLATIHTNNAAGAIVRLINMDIEPFLIASALKLITAQRLARMNCPHCKQKDTPPKELLKKMNIPEDIELYHSVGCDRCNDRGVKGRAGIHEVLSVTKEIQESILTRPSDDQINNIAKEQGMADLRTIALQKASEGIISLKEVIRITQ
jgi:type IV pilus assembly protein PilB